MGLAAVARDLPLLALALRGSQGARVTAWIGLALAAFAAVIALGIVLQPPF